MKFLETPFSTENPKDFLHSILIESHMEIARTLAKEAEHRKSEIESLRNIPEDLMSRAKEADLVRMWAAKAFGGAQRSVYEVMACLQAMAYHNASLAWVVGVTNCSSLFSGYLPEGLARSLFADPMSMVGGFAGPAGIAEQVEGGLKVSGQWSWGSGISHCSHIVGGVRVMDDGKTKGTALVFFEPHEVQLEDNWHVVGLKGTHSINYQVEDLLVPNDRWSVFPISEALIDAPLYRFSSLGALSLSIAVIGLGLAQRAVDEIQSLAQHKRPFGQGRPLAQRVPAQQEVGKIHGNYLAAYSLFYQTIASAELEAGSGKSSVQSKAKIRLAACHTSHLCLQVVRDAYQLAGGSAIWQSGKLEELHRDMHVVSQHGMVAESNYRTAGAVLLGNEVPEIML